MKSFNKKLILAVAAATIVFATGCTTKPSRPVPLDTIGDTTNYTTTTTVVPPAPAAYVNTAPNSGVAGGINAPQFGVTPAFPTATPPVDTLITRPPTDGTLNGNDLRNISTLPPVLFDFDRSAIKASEFGKIQAVKDYLSKNPTQRVLFEGHCDWRGTSEYNMALGDRRANAAKRYAISIGIPANKIETRSVGSSNATENGTEAQMAQDRRAEVVILVK